MSSSNPAPESLATRPRERVLLVASFDSFLRSAVRFGRLLESRGAQLDCVIPFVRNRQLSAAQKATADAPPDTRTLPLAEIATAGVLGSYDVVVLALDGARSRDFFLRFREAFPQTASRRPLTVCLYPGLLFRFHLEGMMCRMGADLFLLNSKKDVRLYDAMLGSLGIAESNGVCGGLVTLAAPKPPRAPGRGASILFVGQPTVPAGRRERLYVLRSLIELAERFPRTPIVLKPRHRLGESTLHRERHHFEALLTEMAAERRIPSNLEIRYDPMSELIGAAGLCITFSSTAALEALCEGVPARVLTDLGVNENIGNHFFLGSGLLQDFRDIAPGLPFAVDPEWFDENVSSAESTIDDVAARLGELLDRQERAGHSLPHRDTRLFGRAPEYTEYVRETEGASGLRRFGEAGGMGRYLERARSERSAWVARVAQYFAALK